MNLVGLTVKFAVTAEEIKKSAIFNGVTRVAPPLPWSFLSSYSLHLFPPHSLLSSKSLNKTKKMNQTFPLFLFLNFLSFLLCQYLVPPSFSSSTSPLFFSTFVSPPLFFCVCPYSISRQYSIFPLFFCLIFCGLIFGIVQRRC